MAQLIAFAAVALAGLGAAVYFGRAALGATRAEAREARRADQAELAAAEAKAEGARIGKLLELERQRADRLDAQLAEMEATLVGTADADELARLSRRGVLRKADDRPDDDDPDRVPDFVSDGPIDTDL